MVYALGYLPYGWLNELSNLTATFHDEHGVHPIRRFVAGCGLLSFTVMLILFWTPLQRPILQNLIGLDASLLEASRVPLMLFAFFPLAVAPRSYFHGIGFIQHRTKAMAPSAPARVLSILVALLLLPLEGATLGVAALLTGFVMETAVVWIGVQYKSTQMTPSVTKLR